MAPAAVKQQLLLPDSMLEIFVRLPRKAFHRCRCLSRAWAATLSSDYFVDRNLSTREKMRLNYDDLMKSLAFGCCLYRGKEEETAAKKRVLKAEIEAKKRAWMKKKSTKVTTDSVYDDDEEDYQIDRREEYRIRGYVQVDKDYQFKLTEVRSQRWRTIVDICINSC